MIGLPDETPDEVADRRNNAARRAAGLRVGSCIWCGVTLTPDDWQFTCESCHGATSQGEEESSGE